MIKQSRQLDLGYLCGYLCGWRSALTILLLMPLVLASCVVPAKNQVVQSERERIPIEIHGESSGAINIDDLTELVAGNSAFAAELYEALRETEDGNLFYSPYSISLALAMTYAGAQGETAVQMADTLHYTLPQAQLHAAFNRLDTTLASYADVAAREEQAEGTKDEPKPTPFQLNIANAIWAQQDFTFLPEYLDRLAENYGAGLRLVDFIEETEAARQIINRWVSEETAERIQNLIAPGVLTPADRMVLTNAIYFKAGWLFQFEPEQTQDAPFTLLDGTTITTPMMMQTENHAYSEGNGYQAISLRYQGADLSMLILLPTLERFAAIEATLTPDFLAMLERELTPTRVQLSMPKFTFEAQFRLGQTLADMGMAVAFSDGADFSGITGARDLAISDVIHKAFVEVDETGTEAAAATAVVMRLTSAMPEEAVTTMTIDHPFFFLIRDEATGAILFMGRVLDPSS